MTHLCLLPVAFPSVAVSCGAFSYETEDLILLNWKIQPFEQNFLCLLRMVTAM